jgi:hypothetical protein
MPSRKPIKPQEKCAAMGEVLKVEINDAQVGSAPWDQMYRVSECSNQTLNTLFE